VPATLESPPPRRSKRRARHGESGALGTQSASADEHRVHAPDGDPREIGRAADAAHVDRDTIARDALELCARGFRVDAEGSQVTGVDADQRGRGVERERELVVVGGLDERREAERERMTHEALEGVERHRAHQQQHHRRTDARRQLDLAFVEHEPLEEDRHRDGLAHATHVERAAPEGGTVGEHADRGRPAIDVGAREPLRFPWSTRADHARARAAELHLRDHPRLAVDRTSQRFDGSLGSSARCG